MTASSINNRFKNLKSVFNQIKEEEKKYTKLSLGTTPINIFTLT
jgi:uncharacterized pyridoxal phosphate-containing UPF0001 family protein